MVRLSLKPDHLARYRDVARLLIKYGRSDIVKTKATDAFDAKSDAENRLDGSVSEQEASAKQLADDLESLGPTFVKLGQLLSTRADLLPPAYLDALTRLQDKVEPFGYEV